MISAGFALGFLVAGLHWWLFAAQRKSLGGSFTTRYVLWTFAGRWGLTIALAVLCLQGLRVKHGDFMTGFLVASLAVRIKGVLNVGKFHTRE
ncbi:MAG: hypothetical protein KF760_11815 [Candidatus Eremiobacteraeota bacterium]|nr:hypothetical protein [Candidatus Eremiobacteraeota bacterium]MCW5868481.1 hypothetical protein [Candidatus Eremiobacteraeota bacterium]